MRDLTNEEVDKVAGGIAPALVGAMYIATHPATIAGAKFAGKAFATGFFTTGGGMAAYTLVNSFKR